MQPLLATEGARRAAWTAGRCVSCISKGMISTVEQASAPCGMCQQHEERCKLPGSPGGARPASRLSIKRRISSTPQSNCQQVTAISATCAACMAVRFLHYKELL